MSGNFLDTNILVYVVTDDLVKKARAKEILNLGGIISVQVLNELTNVLRRKLHVTWPEVETILTMIRDLLTIEPMTIETHETGVAIAKRYGFSIYDSMIVAAGLNSGCGTLWSEDMQNGLTIRNRLRITNPFID